MEIISRELGLAQLTLSLLTRRAVIHENHNDSEDERQALGRSLVDFGMHLVKMGERMLHPMITFTPGENNG